MTAPALACLALAAVAREDAFDADIDAAIRDVEGVFPVPAALVKAVIHVESGFNPAARSRAGAIGLMQVMPYNAPHLGLAPWELWLPRRNILAGTRLLAVLLKHYRGDLISALAGYNARPRPLFAPLPDNGETPAYVAAVLRYFNGYSADRTAAPKKWRAGARNRWRTGAFPKEAAQVRARLPQGRRGALRPPGGMSGRSVTPGYSSERGVP